MFIPMGLFKDKINVPDTRVAWENHVNAVAKKYGITSDQQSPHPGQNDSLDAFRHIYSSAVAAYYSTSVISEAAGNLIEWGGDTFKDQHPAIREMDIHNNALGREIGLSVQSFDEIAPYVVEAIKSGQAMKSPPYKNLFGVSPTPTPKPDAPITGGSVVNVLDGSSGSDTLGVASGGIFSKVAGFFTGRSGDTLTSLVASANTSRTSNLNLESLLGAEISRSADGIVNRIIGRNPDMFQVSAGRFLSQSAERFGEALTKGRIGSIEDAFTSALGGKNGAFGFLSNIGNQVVGGLLQSGLDKILDGTKTSTTSYESARSIAAGNTFGMSRGHQAAEMLTQLQKGQRNL
ncbi:MAG: hypothetical protein MK052_06505 [Alphaproteobacteria bacterium]|nr:hypothetical protein [Alphaproteobacteria bacterium]